AGEVDRSLSVHAGGGRHVGIELIAGNNADAVVLPAFGIAVRMIVIVGMAVVVRAGHCAPSRDIVRPNGIENRGRKPENYGSRRIMGAPAFVRAGRIPWPSTPV